MPTEIRAQKIPAAVRTLLAGVIDFAGLFPPAALSLPAAVRNYATYQLGENSWMLGRFIIPASRLPELSEALRVQTAKEPWKISALAGENYESEMASIVRFNSDNQVHAVVDTIEAKPELQDHMAELIAAAPAGTQASAEIPLWTSSEALTALRRSGAYAKVRTGGLVPGTIPSVRDLAAFLSNAAKSGTPFKATAGLHHPLRCLKPLTYGPDAPAAEMHGFINLLLACGFALSGASIEVLCEVLSDQNAASFEFSDSGVRWKQQRLSNFQLQHARERLLLSFGSCSFEEPVHELSALGWL